MSVVFLSRPGRPWYGDGPVESSDARVLAELVSEGVDTPACWGWLHCAHGSVNKHS